MRGRRFPQGMGHDFAGVVEAVGQGVTLFDVGDAVLGAAPIKGGGAFADVVMTAVNGIAKKPAELSFEEAAAIPTVGVAALQAVVGKGKFLAGQDRSPLHLCPVLRPKRDALEPPVSGADPACALVCRLVSALISVNCSRAARSTSNGT
jgi:hypothetical protein